VSFWAVLKANAVITIVNPLTKANKLAILLNDCEQTALISDGHLTSVLAEAAARSTHLKTVIISGAIDENRTRHLTGVVGWDNALASRVACQPTRPPQHRHRPGGDSCTPPGSTGDPKGVMLTHRNMLTAANSITAYLENVEDDVILNALPLSFDYGLYQMIMVFRMGARLVLERSFRLSSTSAEAHHRRGRHRLSRCPTMFAILAEMKTLVQFDFSKIRYVTNTAASLPLKHITMLASYSTRCHLLDVRLDRVQALHLPAATVSEGQADQCRHRDSEHGAVDRGCG